MKFNKPFEFIRLEMNKIGDIIPTIDRNRKYFVWLDYDNPLDREVLDDVGGFLHVLAPGSIFVVTVDAEPRPYEGSDSIDLTMDQRIDRSVEEFRENLKGFYPGEIKRNIFSRNALPKFFAEILINKINEEVHVRPKFDFLQLFNFQYADGAQMVSIGGIIEEKQAITELQQSDLLRWGFINQSVNPLEISVPALTLREKQWLEQKLDPNLTVEDLVFELPREKFNSFKKFYKYYPSYHETLI